MGMQVLIIDVVSRDKTEILTYNFTFIFLFHFKTIFVISFACVY